jgi:Ca-activated chloride channel family protein
MRFLRLDLLQWWQVLPVLVASWAIHYRYTRRARALTAVAPRFAPLSRRSTWAREAAVLAATLSAGSALVFASVRPQTPLTDKIPEYERQDLILILDRSVSMRARDIRPSRLSRAVAEIRNFVEHKPDAIDRVALVGFADSSVVLSYLTGDLESIAFYLEWIDHDPQTLVGTNIGAALKSAREVARKDNRQTRKVYVLLSDGEDRGEALAHEIEAFQKERLRIHTIGIGGVREVPIPVIQPDGKNDLFRDEDGAVITTRYEEATLREIANVTGGRYIRSTTGAELAPALQEIVKGERRIIGWRTTTEYRDLYRYGLGAAAAAGALLLLLV